MWYWLFMNAFNFGVGVCVRVQTEAIHGSPLTLFEFNGGHQVAKYAISVMEILT